MLSFSEVCLMLDLVMKSNHSQLQCTGRFWCLKKPFILINSFTTVYVKHIKIGTDRGKLKGQWHGNGTKDAHKYCTNCHKNILKGLAFTCQSKNHCQIKQVSTKWLWMISNKKKMQHVLPNSKSKYALYLVSIKILYLTAANSM